MIAQYVLYLLHQLYESFKTVAHRIIIKEMLLVLQFQVCTGSD